MAIPIFLLFAGLFSCIVGLVSSDVKKSNCTFCREGPIGVRLNPNVQVDDIFLPFRYNVSDLLPFVATVASEFKFVLAGSFLNYSDKYESLDLVPLAVATHNAETAKLGKTNFLESKIMIHRNASKERFLRQQEMVKLTNSIYKGTITALLLMVEPWEEEYLSFHEKIEQARMILSESEGDIGLIFFIHRYKILSKFKPKQFSKQIKEVCHLFQSVNFYCFFDPTSLVPVNDTASKEMQVVIEFSQFFKDNCASPLSFGVVVSWPDTMDNGNIRYSRLVEFWHFMVAFGRKENISIIFIQGFDVPSYIPSYSTTGWWRLVDNSSYTATSQFVFEDKQTVAERELRKTPQDIRSQIMHDVMFDRENVAIDFTLFPAIVPHTLQTELSIPDLPQLVEVISSKFTLVSVRVSDIKAVFGNSGIEMISRVIREKKMQIVFVIESDIESEINSVTQQILSINQNHPHLINQIIIKFSRFNETMQLQRLIHSNISSHLILVGLNLKIDECYGPADNTFYISRLNNTLRFVDIVYFSYVPGHTWDHGYVYGVERVVRQTTAWFENCKRRIEKNIPGLQVGFHTGFPDTLKTREKNYASLAIFWKEMNSWAKRTNTKIIFTEAFDSAFTRNNKKTSNHLGWWRLKYQEGTQNQWVFEEKRTTALNNLTTPVKREGSKTPQYEWLLPTLIPAVSTTAILIIIVFLVKQYRKRKDDTKFVSEEALRRELQSKEITILHHTAFVEDASEAVGRGNFGSVYKCFMSQFQSDVAVKTLSKRDQGDDQDMAMARKSLLSEIKIMCHVGTHENLLRLLGVCLDDGLFMVTEYCKLGSLLSYLRLQAANKEVLTNYQLLQFCMEITAGMQFLREKKVIHADLSARNVLLDGNKMCKICDFGLSRKLEQYEKYMKKGEEPLPWRWMAIESLTRLEFSYKSDVWSMGVTFWEIFSMGKMPFPEMSWDGTFCEKLAEGFRLDKPELAKENMYAIMLSCWELQSKNRPDFDSVLSKLKELRLKEYDGV